MACLPCAIEMEPKTLSPGQINHAKEQAEAIQKMEPENASDIFIQGLEQISEEDNSIVDDCIKEEKNILGKSRHCLCNTILIQSPDEIRQKEPATAPF